MRTKTALVALCMIGAAWPVAAGANAAPTSTTVAPSTASAPPAPVKPAAAPAKPAAVPATPTKPTQAQIDAFLRALVPPNTGSGRRIIYSNTWQRVWLVDDANRLVRSYLVSGRRNTPHAGVYRVYSKSRFASSGSAHMEFMVRFAHGRSMAIGFHSIPYVGRRPLSTIQQLGTYRSHGCVRQWIFDAAYLYMWAPIGTVVVVTP
jgi:lipoprotein-anchoring transpeptidase ErfK/SrfK